MINKTGTMDHPVKTHSKLRFQWFSPTTLFNRQWWWVTLLVLVAMGVMVRLGIWQLNRLEERRARNSHITRQLNEPPLLLTGSHTLPNNLTRVSIRQATAHGKFDLSRQIALVYQNRQGSPGVHLLVPLLIEGSSEAVLVNRGWIPFDQSAPEQWVQFDEQGTVTVTGFIGLTEELPPDATQNQTNNSIQSPQTEWFRIDINAIQNQLPYPLLPVYLLQSPSAKTNNTPPYRVSPNFDLSEGSHLGYAIQWFLFAVVTGTGYIYLVGKEVAKETSGSAVLGGNGTIQD